MFVSTATLVILTISAFMSAVIASIMGMAGGVLFLGILASFVETKYVVPLYAVIMVVSNSTRLVLFFKHINWRIVGFYIIGLLPGALIGIYIFRLLPKDFIKLMMGLFILGIVAFPVKNRKGGQQEKIFVAVGFVAGFIGIFFGASGPFTSIFYMRQGIIKEELVGTKAVCQTIDHLIKICLFGFIGISVTSAGTTIGYLSVAVIGGTFIGKKLLNRISDRAFMVIFKILLLIIAARIVVIQIVRMIG